MFFSNNQKKTFNFHMERNDSSLPRRQEDGSNIQTKDDGEITRDAAAIPRGLLMDE
jgi:hypothetical protein